MADHRFFVPVTDLNRNAALCSSISLNSLAEPYSASFCMALHALAKREAAMVIVRGLGREPLADRARWIPGASLAPRSAT
jgi:hypothetical protein